MLPTRIVLLLLTVLFSLCGLAYELFLAQFLSELTGNYLLWQCFGIGLYLGCLGIGTVVAGKILRKPEEYFKKFFLRSEWALSLMGASSGLILNLFYFLFKVYLVPQGPQAASPLISGLFLLIGLVYISCLGFLAGLEIPFLHTLYHKENPTPKSFSHILAANYFGALLGGVLFAAFFLPILGTSHMPYFLGLITFIGFIFLALFLKKVSSLEFGILFCLGVGGLISTLHLSPWASNLATQGAHYGKEYKNSPEVMTYHSPYQKIEIVFEKDSQEYALHLDGKLQFHTVSERTYHVPFIHLPIKLLGHIPKRALILGGGDGLVARELLHYPEIRSITQVELDPLVLELAKSGQLLMKLNQNALNHPKVKVLEGDAYAFIRESSEYYDAIFLDFPRPDHFDLSKLYSQEFYSMLKARLAPKGFIVLDTPHKDSGPWSYQAQVMMNTLKASGFLTFVPYSSLFDSFILVAKEDLTLQEKVVAATHLKKEAPGPVPEIPINTIVTPRILRARDLWRL